MWVSCGCVMGVAVIVTLSRDQPEQHGSRSGLLRMGRVSARPSVRSFCARCSGKRTNKQGAGVGILVGGIVDLTHAPGGHLDLYGDRSGFVCGLDRDFVVSLLGLRLSSKEIDEFDCTVPARNKNGKRVRRPRFRLQRRRPARRGLPLAERLGAASSLEEDTSAYFLDVGEGDCIAALLLGGSTVLVDAGTPEGRTASCAS
ncbi:MAG: hypothetical protein ACLR4Z_17620 [Butyricicoccaceae bacterium]